MHEFLCLSASPETHILALTHWFNPWHSRINQKVGGLCVEWVFEFLSQCSYHCGLPYTHQYVTIRVRNSCTHAQNWERISVSFSHTFYCYITTLPHPGSLLCCPVGKTVASRWSLAVCVQFTTGHWLKMKPEHYSFSFRSSKPHCTALTVSGFCSSFTHTIKNNCWSLGKLMRIKYKPESRCISVKFSDVWVDNWVVRVDRCMTRLTLWPWWRASGGGWYLGFGYSDPPEKLSTPLLPTPPPSYLTARNIPCLTDMPHRP